LEDILADRSRWKEELINDFEASIFKNHPAIAEIKERLYGAGAYYAAMSGSGSSVFGLFDQLPEVLTWPSGYFACVEQL
jgi:4-diphosphocytidyl-2-C-methyl-D-erythritol kinase